MGCVCKRESLPSEEFMIRHEEFKLSYNNIQLSDCQRVFNKFAKGSFLSQYDFEQAMDELNLPYLNNSSDECIEEFYRSLCTGGEYQLRMLKITAVFLSNGDLIQKTEALFNIYDYDESHTISIAEVGLMMEDLYQIACVSLPKMVNFKSAGGDFITVFNYLKMIYAVKLKVSIRLTEFLLHSSKSVTKYQFMERMTTHPLSALVSSMSIRCLHRDEFNSYDDIERQRIYRPNS